MATSWLDDDASAEPAPNDRHVALLGVALAVALGILLALGLTALLLVTLPQ